MMSVCKHCGKPIRRDKDLPMELVHDNGLFFCTDECTTMATPVPATYRATPRQSLNVNQK